MVGPLLLCYQSVPLQRTRLTEPFHGQFPLPPSAAGSARLQSITTAGRGAGAHLGPGTDWAPSSYPLFPCFSPLCLTPRTHPSVHSTLSWVNSTSWRELMQSKGERSFSATIHSELHKFSRAYTREDEAGPQGQEGRAGYPLYLGCNVQPTYFNQMEICPREEWLH